MTVATPTEANPPLFWLGAWTPFGRAPRPLDLPHEDRVRLGRREPDSWIWWVSASLALLYISLHSGMDSMGGFVAEHGHAITIVLFGINLIVLAGAYFRSYCWAARRLHDVGRSSWPYVKRHLLAWLAILTLIIVWLLMIVRPDFNVASSVIFGVLFISLLPGSVAVTIFSLWYRGRVLEPFARYLNDTPGDPGPNRYGPPPKTVV